MNWSVVWEAVAAVGTMLAVVWAVITTVTERRKRSAVEKELTAEKAASRVAKRREQAEHVAVWIDTEQVSVPAKLGRGFDMSVAVVGNYSSAPIFLVAVTGDAVLSDKSFVIEHVNVVPPVPDPWTASLGDADEYRGELLVHVEFSDVAGVRWRRSSNGDLEELPDQRPQHDTRITEVGV